MLRFAPDCCDSSASLANPGNSALMSMDWLYGCSQVAPRSRENTKKDVKPWPLDVSTPTIHSGPCVKHYETLSSMKFLMCNQLWKHLGTEAKYGQTVLWISSFAGDPSGSDVTNFGSSEFLRLTKLYTQMSQKRNPALVRCTCVVPNVRMRSTAPSAWERYPQRHRTTSMYILVT